MPWPDTAGLGCWTGAGVKERTWSGAWLCGMNASQNAAGGKAALKNWVLAAGLGGKWPFMGAFVPRRGLLIFKTVLMEIY